jgi:hypothetical protein
MRDGEGNYWQVKESEKIHGRLFLSYLFTRRRSVDGCRGRRRKYYFPYEFMAAVVTETCDFLFMKKLDIKICRGLLLLCYVDTCMWRSGGTAEVA